MKINNNNLVENMKKNIEGLKEVNKKIEKQQKKVDTYKKEQKDYIKQLREKQGFFRTTPEQYEKIKIFDEIIKKLNNKINLLVFYKNIGEKTTEKINNFVNDYFMKKYNLVTRFYFDRNYSFNGNLSYINFTLKLCNSKDCLYISFMEYQTTLHFDFEPYETKDLVNISFTGINAHFIYNYDENLNFEIVDEPAAEAKKIKSINEKLLARKNKLLKEFENLKDENNKLFTNNLYNLQENYIKEYIKNY